MTKKPTLKQLIALRDSFNEKADTYLAKADHYRELANKADRNAKAEMEMVESIQQTIDLMQQRQADKRPVHRIFLVDGSGSMSGTHRLDPTLTAIEKIVTSQKDKKTVTHELLMIGEATGPVKIDLDNKASLRAAREGLGCGSIFAPSLTSLLSPERQKELKDKKLEVVLISDGGISDQKSSAHALSELCNVYQSNIKIHTVLVVPTEIGTPPIYDILDQAGQACKPTRHDFSVYQITHSHEQSSYDEALAHVTETKVKAAAPAAGRKRSH